MRTIKMAALSLDACTSYTNVRTHPYTRRISRDQIARSCESESRRTFGITLSLGIATYRLESTRARI